MYFGIFSKVKLEMESVTFQCFFLNELYRNREEILCREGQMKSVHRCLGIEEVLFYIIIPKIIPWDLIL
jgi:hypothetical protein